MHNWLLGGALHHLEKADLLDAVTDLLQCELSPFLVLERTRHTVEVFILQLLPILQVLSSVEVLFLHYTHFVEIDQKFGGHLLLGSSHIIFCLFVDLFNIGK